VGVQVHETGSDDAVTGVDDALGVVRLQLADPGDPAVLDAKVSAQAGCPRPVDDHAVLDDGVEERHSARPLSLNCG
jgi:hypothetical protein